VFLKFAVKEGSRKSPVSFFPRHSAGCVQPHPVALFAPERSLARNTEQICVKVITISTHQIKPDAACKLFHRLKPPPVFQIGMDVGIIEISRRLHPFLLETEIGIDRAWSAAYMQKNFHAKLHTEDGEPDFLLRLSNTGRPQASQKHHTDHHLRARAVVVYFDPSSCLGEPLPLQQIFLDRRRFCSTEIFIR
jgi:hypothetical protein